ncbi:MAG: polysaccharide biosynthesis protein [Gammaproteobacteria bacterium]|nr:polysaccharide biosynthesis protein [Gammaproteobacteria bacterium]
MHYLAGKNILITGVCGTVGSELAQALIGDARYDIGKLTGIDNNETELFFVDQRFLSDQRANFMLCDIRDVSALTEVMRGVDVVFHTAAYKHVILCERSPDEAVNTNIVGVRNVVKAAKACGVEKVVFTSSDKAVNPTNVMGTSKLMGERLITAANNSRSSDTVFASTRFGNVLGSNGSVIPIFQRQIEAGGPVTLTDEDMTRFVMTVEESVRLIIDSAALACGGEVFITKMPILRIKDLAEVMIETLAEQYGRRPEDIKVDIIGSKPGEKLYEELMSDEETRRAIELEQYFAVMPAFRGFYKSVDFEYPDVISEVVTNPYVSSQEEMMDKQQIKRYLLENDLLGDRIDSGHDIAERYWPGDKEESQQ